MIVGAKVAPLWRDRNKMVERFCSGQQGVGGWLGGGGKGRGRAVVVLEHALEQRGRARVVVVATAFLAALFLAAKNNAICRVVRRRGSFRIPRRVFSSSPAVVLFLPFRLRSYPAFAVTNGQRRNRDLRLTLFENKYAGVYK